MEEGSANTHLVEEKSNSPRSETEVETETEGTTSSFIITKKRVLTRMTWDDEKNEALLEEVVFARPFQYRSGTRERGKVWDSVAENLQDRHDMKVDGRAVRDRVRLLMKKQREYNRRKIASGGSSVGEETPEEQRNREILDELMAEEEFIEYGKEMRKRASDTFRETKRYREGESSVKKSRPSTASDTGEFSKQKLEMKLRYRRANEDRRRTAEHEQDVKFEMFLQLHQELQQQLKQQHKMIMEQLTLQNQKIEQQMQTTNYLLSLFKRKIKLL
ncbi:uncharacterized protein [Diadema antillarum]|uniref:uncharacterized protein n=1 Tax=Diadema antillarum TaxID=105358 RepID=UPI003A883D06